MGIFEKKLLTTFWVSILPELEILQRTPQKWKIENPLSLGDFRAKRWIFLTAPGKNRENWEKSKIRLPGVFYECCHWVLGFGPNFYSKTSVEQAKVPW